jgi:hypothetical protein
VTTVDRFDPRAAWNDPSAEEVRCTACGDLVAKRVPPGAQYAGFLFGPLQDQDDLQPMDDEELAAAVSAACVGWWFGMATIWCACGMELISLEDAQAPVRHRRLSVLEQAEHVARTTEFLREREED